MYSGGLAEDVNESILHAAFIPFGDIKDVKTPLDQATQKHRSFGFVTFLEKEDAVAAMDNMDGAELYGRVLTVNYALPEKIKGGEQGWAAQPRKFFTRNPNSTPLTYLFLQLGLINAKGTSSSSCSFVKSSFKITLLRKETKLEQFFDAR